MDPLLQQDQSNRGEVRAVGEEGEGEESQQANSVAAASSPAASSASSSVLSVEVDAFLIGCLNNAKDRPFVLAVDDQLARLAITPLQLAPVPSSSADPNSVVPLVPTVDFPPLSSYHRRIVHRIAEHYGLAHRVFDLDHPQLAAMIPTNTTSKYRHVQVMHHPHTAPKSPQSLLRLRDLVPTSPPAPTPSLYSSPPVSRGVQATGLSQGPPLPPWDLQRTPPVASSTSNVYSPVPPKGYIPMRRSPSPQSGSGGVWSPSQMRSPQPHTVYNNPTESSSDITSQTGAPAAVVQTPQPVGPVRLLQRKQPDPKPIKAAVSPILSTPLASGDRPSASSASLGAPGAQVESDASGASENVASDAISAGEVSSVLSTLDTMALATDEDDDDSHIDERLRSQLRVREEEYAKARARIFGNTETALVSEDDVSLAAGAATPSTQLGALHEGFEGGAADINQQ
eukprot:TRINITY_DN5651_c0_g1_i2.p1 TRINITY_DN5651_c0_g1~~TRINITY_DN5651_c0_g1_i2.p1  ORF type:complete len:455 (+),score=78.21 TRINITY_DN5651_c0_g1_i2:108-1472(+)